MKKQNVKFELVDMLRSTCQLKNPSIIVLTSVYELTDGQPCKDCAYKNACKAKQELERVKTVAPSKPVKYQITNAQFSNMDKTFLTACELVGIRPTTRQASKFRMKKGLAFSKKAEASIILKEKGGKV